MQIHDEFSGTITLTENTSRELFKVLKEQDEAFINDVLDGRCGFTLKSADGRSVELVPNTNKRCQCSDLINGRDMLLHMHEELCDGIKCDNCTMCTEDGGCMVEEWIDKFPSAERSSE